MNVFGGELRTGKYGLINFVYQEVNKIETLRTGQPNKLIALKIAREYGSLKYLDDLGEHYKTFEETKQDGGGDCEDLTVWVLCRLIEEGIDPSIIGFHIIFYNDPTRPLLPGHIAPLIWFDNRCWTIEPKKLIWTKGSMWADRDILSEILLVRGFPKKNLQSYTFKRPSLQTGDIEIDLEIYDRERRPTWREKRSLNNVKDVEKSMKKVSARPTLDHLFGGDMAESVR